MFFNNNNNCVHVHVFCSRATFIKFIYQFFTWRSGKRAGLITQRSEDQNLTLLNSLFFFNHNNGVRVHALPHSIGAFQTVLPSLLFRDTVSGFSQGVTETQDVTTTLTFGLKRGTSLLDFLFGRKRFFLDTIRVSLHDGMIRLSLFVETDALHLSHRSNSSPRVLIVQCSTPSCQCRADRKCD